MKKIFINISLEEHITLDEETTHHVFNVLRHDRVKPFTIGHELGGEALYEVVEIVDGLSHWKRVSPIQGKPIQPPVVLIQSYLKGDKFEWILQKGTELQVSAFFCLATTNSIPQYDNKKLIHKQTRWEKIIKEAAQQCNRQTLPTLVTAKSITEANAYLGSHFSHIAKVVAYENENGYSLKDYFQQNPNHASGTALFIGPEGGFQEEEINLLEHLGFRVVSLGNTILRAETAAIAGISIITYEQL